MKKISYPKSITLLAFSLFVVFCTVYSGCQDDPYLGVTSDGNAIITPKSRAFVNMIQVNSFPATDSTGASWDESLPLEGDSLGLPDIFFNITDPSPDAPVYWSQISHFSNVAPGDTTPFFLTEPFEVIPFNSQIDINLYDFDLPDSTFMGKATFFIGEYPDPTNPYPAYVTTEQNGVSITIGLTWKE